MTKLLSQELMSELLNVQASLYLSLYMPTHRVHPENLQDPLRFKELVKKLDSALTPAYSMEQKNKLLAPFQKLAGDFDFWQHVKDGLAVLATDTDSYIILLDSPVKEMAVVADSFHTKPLRKYLQTLERYQVIGLTLQDVRFFEGNRHALQQVPLVEGVPETIEDALGDQLTQKYLTISSGGSATGNARISHGHGSKSDEIDKDTERFFTVVARAVEEHYSRKSKLPLILVALPEHHNVFQRVSNNPCLLPSGVGVNPKSVPLEKLKDMVWEVVEPAYFERLDKVSERYKQAQANGNGSDTLGEIARAAAMGKVDTLILEADRAIRGRLDKNTGEVLLPSSQEKALDDLLDDIGELVTAKSGNVVVMPVERMPTFSGIAAIFRY